MTSGVSTLGKTEGVTGASSGAGISLGAPPALPPAGSSPPPNTRLILLLLLMMWDLGKLSPPDNGPLKTRFMLPLLLIISGLHQHLPPRCLPREYLPPLPHRSVSFEFSLTKFTRPSTSFSLPL